MRDYFSKKNRMQRYINSCMEMLIQQQNAALYKVMYGNVLLAISMNFRRNSKTGKRKV